ncbi:hypothetical protein [Methylovulum psychrotolerans]|uniref:Uncharacterized protein n=1 Tax=Methylovulum psychrotolerans TaxID=1704499 RepID=A0A2S5CR58_9GAMM|nr:hypothetical protein [Methylovulum psychrotolerans]POZ53310.1 hypothetical protein AADEFJLK_00330 [Methylovulum psychrotolerans]
MDNAALSQDQIKQTVVNLYQLFLNQAGSADSYDAFFIAQHSALMALAAIKDLLGDAVPADCIIIINAYSTLIDQFEFEQAVVFNPVQLFTALCVMASSVALAALHPFAVGAASLVLLVYGVEKFFTSFLGEDYGFLDLIRDFLDFFHPVFLKIKAGL